MTREQKQSAMYDILRYMKKSMSEANCTTVQICAIVDIITECIDSKKYTKHVIDYLHNAILCGVKFIRNSVHENKRAIAMSCKNYCESKIFSYFDIKFSAVSIWCSDCLPKRK